jgi:hypothetical protein
VLNSVGVWVELAEDRKKAETHYLLIYTDLSHYTTARCHCIVFLDFIAIYITVV